MTRSERKDPPLVMLLSAYDACVMRVPFVCYPQMESGGTWATETILDGQNAESFGQ